MPKIKDLNTSIPNLQSLDQTGHIVSDVYLVLVCKKGSNAILKSALGRAEFQNVNVRPRDILKYSLNELASDIISKATIFT